MDRPDDLPDDFEPNIATPAERIQSYQLLLEHLIIQLQAERVPTPTYSRYLNPSITHLEEAQHWLHDHARWLETSGR